VAFAIASADTGDADEATDSGLLHGIDQFARSFG
jgi:hypothetical protein